MDDSTLCDNVGSTPPYDSTPEQHLNHRSRLQEEENIPQGLKDRPQWVVRIGKVFYQPRRPDKKAKSNDPSTWGTYEKALEVFQKNPAFDGIGYASSEDDPFVGFDYDDCIDPATGELHGVVSRQVEDLNSYTEISPSGKGLRVIVEAKKPGVRCSNKKTPWGDEFAMYENKRFFTLTGRVLGGYTEIREAQEAVDRAYRAMFGEDQEPPPRTEDRGNDLLSDEELIERACRSEKGARFRRHHYDGDSSGYASRSEADQAHLADLCFWTGGDLERMVELFTRSALYIPSKGQRYVRFSASKALNTHKGGYYSGKKKEVDRELLELVEAIEDKFWKEEFPGPGGKSVASLIRALISEGKRIGTIAKCGSLRVEVSWLQLSEIVKCHPNTIGNAARRAKEAGLLEKDTLDRKEEHSGAFLIPDPRRACGTHENTLPSESRCVLRGTTSLSRPHIADLRTAYYRWRSPVGKLGERVLCRYEAFGDQTDEEIARWLGWSRTRDVRLRVVERLQRLGLIESRGGKRGLAHDFQRVQEEVRQRKYSTIQFRIKRVYSHTEGRRVSDVVESGSYASEVERDQALKKSNERKRQGFRYHLEERRRTAKLQREERIEASRAEKKRREEDKRRVLNTWDEERGSGWVEEEAA